MGALLAAKLTSYNNLQIYILQEPLQFGENFKISSHLKKQKKKNNDYSILIILGFDLFPHLPNEQKYHILLLI